MGSSAQHRYECRETHCRQDYTKGDFCDDHQPEKKVKRCQYINKNGDPCVTQVWADYCSYHERAERIRIAEERKEAERKKEEREEKRKLLVETRAKAEKEKELEPLHSWLEN